MNNISNLKEIKLKNKKWILTFYQIKSQCLVPVRSNISCHHVWLQPQTVSVLAVIRTRVPHISQWLYVVIFQMGTQQENSTKQHAVTTLCCDCNAWQSKWGFMPNVKVICCYHKLLWTARWISWREWKANCCKGKQESYKVSKPEYRLWK